MENQTIRKQRLMQSFGFFQVRYDNEVVPFDVLEEAYYFFKQLDVAATLWDMSIIPYIIGTKEGIQLA